MRKKLNFYHNTSLIRDVADESGGNDQVNVVPLV